MNTKESLWCNALSHTFVGVPKDLYESCESQIVSNIILGLSSTTLCFRVLGLGPIQWKYAVSQSRDLV